MKNVVDGIKNNFQRPEVHVAMNREAFLVVGLASLTVYMAKKLNKTLKKQ